MIILGLHDNHSASAALLVDGEVVAVAEEERFTRIKMDSGFPKNAIDALQKEYPNEFKHIDRIAVGCVHQSFTDFATKKYPNFKIKDFLVEEERFWLPKMHGKNPDYLKVMNNYVDFSKCHYPLDRIKNINDNNELRALRKSHIANYLGKSQEEVEFVDHHLCHAHHAYFSSPIRNDALIFTIDGWGDHTNATVCTVKNGSINCEYRTENFNIGRIYHFITQLLGMQPEQHEYKVMGLAAYAKEHIIKEPLKVFERAYSIEGLEIKPLLNIQNHYQYFRKNLEGFRFDAIAGAVQRFTEKIVCQWVSNWIVETGYSKIVLSGGVSLNIKASKKISELDQIEDIHVCLGGGDESLSIGAAQFIWSKFQDAKTLKPISKPYLDLGFEEDDTKLAISHPFVTKRYNIRKAISAKDIAKILSKGEIVAYMQGRMEFGPRALGNRSFLASPMDPSIVKVINNAIKNRDFWMPFTPSILDKHASDYIINPKNINAHFMTMAFDSTDKAKTDLAAAIHPIDATLRPQVVRKDYSPEYYDIISEFEKITGVGALLNTSLNIHGKPIVHKPINVVEEILMNELVDVKFIVFGDTLLSAKAI
ncbi:MAG: hypothetical protein CMH70_03905 [Nitrosomonadaceae bacterium]|nr:hypothetical protein [Nitrosomonadaceae bacterium]|tara:strand:- start:5329 stop:7104 length:1776 start_codon:yes stop_codon:yes gene_type:complete